MNRAKVRLGRDKVICCVFSILLWLMTFDSNEDDNVRNIRRTELNINQPMLQFLIVSLG